MGTKYQRSYEQSDKSKGTCCYLSLYLFEMKNFLKKLLFDSKQCYINKVIWRLRIIMRGFFKNSVLFY